MNTSRPHSIDYIDDERYQWWSKPHLESIVNRLEIGAVSSMLDVGVGGGHWGTLLASLYTDRIEIAGVDVEQHWVTQSEYAYKEQVPQHCYTASKGDAHHLPFDDRQFDLATCQTLLMHCHTPRQVVNEMVRVTKPGGSLFIAEPMNYVNRVLLSSCLAASEIDTTSLWKVWAYYNRARQIAGYGDENIAATLPTLLRNHPDLTSINAFQTETIRIGQPDETIQTIQSEFEKPQIVNHMMEGGATRKQIDDAASTLSRLRKKLENQLVTSPTPLILFATQKHS